MTLYYAKMSNIINNLTIHKTLEYWKPHAFTNIINYMDKLYYSTNPLDKTKYESYIKILKNSKNFIERVEVCITEVWSNSELQHKVYHNIWREFVINFEKADRIIIVNEIRRIITEKEQINNARLALSVSINSEEKLKKENDELKKEVNNMKNMIKTLQRRNQELLRIIGTQ